MFVQRNSYVDTAFTAMETRKSAASSFAILRPPFSTISRNIQGRRIIPYRYENCQPPAFPWHQRKSVNAAITIQQRVLRFPPSRNKRKRNGLAIKIEQPKAVGRK